MEKEPKESGPQLPENERFDFSRQKFPEIVRFKGQMYDLRTISESETGLYRMTSEARIELNAPSYLEVNKEGFIIKAWD